MCKAVLDISSVRRTIQYKNASLYPSLAIIVNIVCDFENINYNYTIYVSIPLNSIRCKKVFFLNYMLRIIFIILPSNDINIKTLTKLTKIIELQTLNSLSKINT